MAARNMDLRLLKKLVFNTMDYSDAGVTCKRLLTKEWDQYMHSFQPEVSLV